MQNFILTTIPSDNYHTLTSPLILFAYEDEMSQDVVKSVDLERCGVEN